MLYTAISYLEYVGIVILMFFKPEHVHLHNKN